MMIPRWYTLNMHVCRAVTDEAITEVYPEYTPHSHVVTTMVIAIKPPRPYSVIDHQGFAFDIFYMPARSLIPNFAANWKRRRKLRKAAKEYLESFDDD